VISDAELRGLLLDCLAVWDVPGSVTVRQDDLALEVAGRIVTVARAGEDMRPVRWFFQTPERAAAGRPPRAVPSVVALLSGLRGAVDGAGGDRLRVGG
jgi:hypothetical protein